MSKELEALNDLRHGGLIEKYKNKCCDIIETALKRQEQDQSKLKAFKIIKEKKVDVGLFVLLFIENADINGGYDNYINAYKGGSNNAYKGGSNNAYDITRESRKPLEKHEIEILIKALL